MGSLANGDSEEKVPLARGDTGNEYFTLACPWGTVFLFLSQCVLIIFLLLQLAVYAFFTPTLM